MQRFINWGTLSHKTTSTSTMTLTLGAAVALMIGAGAIFTPTSAAADGCMTFNVTPTMTASADVIDDGVTTTNPVILAATDVDDDGVLFEDDGAIMAMNDVRQLGEAGDDMSGVLMTVAYNVDAENLAPQTDPSAQFVHTADLTFDDSVTGAPGQTTMNIFLAALTELPADGATETPIWTIAALSMTGTDLPLTTDVVEDAPAS